MSSHSASQNWPQGLGVVVNLCAAGCAQDEVVELQGIASSAPGCVFDVEGFGFRDQGFGVRVYYERVKFGSESTGFGIRVSGVRSRGSGFSRAREVREREDGLRLVVLEHLVLEVERDACRHPDPRHLVRGFGFGVQGSGFRVQGAGFRVQGIGPKIQCLVIRVGALGFGV